MDTNIYAIKLEQHNEKMRVFMSNRDEIEKETRSQANSEKWYKYRQNFVTASLSSRICRKRDYTSCGNIV